MLNNSTELFAFPLDPIPKNSLVDSSENGTQFFSNVTEEKGCFGYPPGRLNASTPEIIFSTRMMLLRHKYDVCVLASKETRKRSACTTIEIVEGDPPVVIIR